MAKPGPTLHQVADRAGVSIATVSRVVHGGTGVSVELCDRVQSAIAHLGYRPSHLGRALAQRRHRALGVVLPGLYGPYHAEVIHGFEAVAIRERLAVLLLGTHQLEETADHVFALADRTDGLAILGGSVPADLIEALSARGTPLVLVAQHPMLDLPTVRSDNHASAIDLTRHLLDHHGLRRLAFLGNPVGSADVMDRWEGFRAAHRHLGLTPPDEPVASPLEVHHGHRAGLEILAAPDRPEGIVCANDELAIGVLSAANTLGLDLPRDIAVTGWDDIPLARHASPPLTTVRQPSRAIGTRAARLLVDDFAGAAQSPRRITLSTTPVYRASCGCPPPEPHARLPDAASTVEGGTLAPHTV